MTEILIQQRLGGEFGGGGIINITSLDEIDNIRTVLGDQIKGLSTLKRAMREGCSSKALINVSDQDLDILLQGSITILSANILP